MFLPATGATPGKKKLCFSQEDNAIATTQNKYSFLFEHCLCKHDYTRADYGMGAETAYARKIVQAVAPRYGRQGRRSPPKYFENVRPELQTKNK